jgi:uncharacterized protein YdaU (DUF1376 family)
VGTKTDRRIVRRRNRVWRAVDAGLAALANEEDRETENRRWENDSVPCSDLKTLHESTNEREPAATAQENQSMSSRTKRKPGRREIDAARTNPAAE